MRMLLARRLGLSLASLLMLGATAAADGVDRSGLSVDDNTTINMACFSARKQNEAAFNRCVTAQLAALREHPSPDRSLLPPRRNRDIDYACAFYRRQGVVAYNGCIGRQLAEATQTVVESPTDTELRPDLVAAVKAVADEKPSATPVAMTTIGSPSSVLPRWSGRSEAEALSAKDFFKKVSGSVYLILSARSQPDFRAGHITQGSAVAISEHLLLTNCHVVSERGFIRIFYDRTPYEAVLVGADTATDRCVLRAEAATLKPVSGVRAFEDLADGEHVFAIGTPQGLQHTLSEGLISGLRSSARRNIVQTTAPISPGSSGGGLFDDRGNLIAITTAQLTGSQNLNFAVAASDFWH